MNKIMEEKNALKYQNEKIHTIQSYEDNDFIDFFKGITGKDERSEFNKILKKLEFLPSNFKPENRESYNKALFLFIKALKDTKDEYVYKKEKNYKGVKAAAVHIWKQFELVFLFWLTSQSEFSSFIKEKCGNEKVDLSIICTGEFIAELCEYSQKELKISKEKILTFYKFSPIPKDEELEEEFISKSIESKFISLLEPLIERERIQIKELKEQKEKDFAKLDELNQQLKNLDILREDNVSLSDKIQELLEENKCLNSQINNAPKHIELEKVQQSYEDKIQILESKINEYEDNKALYSDYDQRLEELNNKIVFLEKANKLKIQDLFQKLDDSESKEILLSLILNDSSASRLIIDKLNLKRQIIENNKKLFLEELNELEDSKIELEKHIENLGIELRELEEQKDLISINSPKMMQISKLFEYKQENTPLSLRDNELFIKEYMDELSLENVINENHLEKAKLLHSKITKNVNSKDNFLIVPDKKIIDCWIAAQKIEDNRKNNFVLDVIVEPQWTSYKDWFGYFENEIFYPSTTMIADFYDYVSSSEEVPFAFINFIDFNKIMPEFYLLPFIQGMQEIKDENGDGFLYLTHPTSKVSPEYEKFKKIKFLRKLKFVFTKTSDDDNSFEIPKAFSKHCSTIEIETSNE